MRRVVAAWITLLCLSTTPLHAERLGSDIAFSVGDYATAYREWLAAANAGDASAMTAVGTLYDMGHGIPQDFAAALSWYRRAAEAGNVRGMFNVGAMYDNGRGSPVNRAEAIRWYDMAAQRGNGRAAYDLGIIYRDGDGVFRNTASAIRYFGLAAAAGIGAARTNLAALGNGMARKAPVLAYLPRSSTLPTNGSAAEIGRFQRAAFARTNVGAVSSKTLSALISALTEGAANGNSLAQYDLGFAYDRGLAVPSDPVKSYVFYLRAAASSDANVKAAALKGAAEVGHRLTEAQHAAARDMLVGSAF